MSYAFKRQLTRVFLLLHFVGLTACLGTIFTNVLIERTTRSESLQLLSFARDLTSLSSQILIQTGFLTMVFTGILLTLLRYGIRAPLWAWLKLALSIVIFVTVTFALDPARSAATEWAHWSAQHGQLAQQFLDSASRATAIGRSVLLLFAITTIVAIWKPMWPGSRGRRAAAATGAAVSQASAS